MIKQHKSMQATTLKLSHHHRDGEPITKISMQRKIPLIINIIKINMMCAIIFKRKLHTFFVLCGSQPLSRSFTLVLRTFWYV